MAFYCNGANESVACAWPRAMNNPQPGNEHILALIQPTLIGLPLMLKKL